MSCLGKLLNSDKIIPEASCCVQIISASSYAAWLKEVAYYYTNGTSFISPVGRYKILKFCYLE